MVDPIFDYQFRLILIGDSTVGKSSLLRYFTDGKFSELSDPTVGVDFFSRLVQVRDGTRIKLQLWDTAGQERFRSITKSYYRNSVGAILAYDITSHPSFERIAQWMSEARRYIEPFRPVFLLVGCKADLASAGHRQVLTDEAFSFSAAMGIHCVETSAKTGTNVEEAFQIITQEIYNRIQSGEYKVDDENWDGIKTGFSGALNNNLLEAEAAQDRCC
jgi:Ras-related protein Rab-39B